MNSEKFVQAIAPALTDADARASLVADPRPALAAAGLELPEWVQVTVVEGERPAIQITIPPMLDPEGELTEDQLAVVTGGCGPVRHPDPNQSYGIG